MKVMNVGNANYANSRQQNFGMVLHPPYKGTKLLDEKALKSLSKAVESLKTKSGKELHIEVQEISVPEGLSLSTYSLDGSTKRLNMVVTPAKPIEDLSSFVDTNVTRLYDRVLNTLKAMNNIFDMV